MQRRVVLVLGLLSGVLLTNLFYSTLTTYTTSTAPSLDIGPDQSRDNFQRGKEEERQQDAEHEIEKERKQRGSKEREAEKEDCQEIGQVKELIQKFSRRIEGMREEMKVLEDTESRRMSDKERANKGSLEDEKLRQEDKQLEKRWLSSMLRIRETFAGKKGANATYNTSNTHNTHNHLNRPDEDERVTISKDTELCVVWKFEIGLAISEHYAFLHDFLLYHLDANVRIVPHYLNEDGCMCANLLVVVPDKIIYSARRVFDDIAAVRKSECRDSSVGIFVYTPREKEFLPLVHKEIVEGGIEVFDYVLFNSWHTTLDLDPDRDNYLWIPLGHSSGIPPPSYPQIVPSSKRRHFCSWRGMTWEPIRQELVDDLVKLGQTEPRLNCSMGPLLAPIMFRAELLETVIAITPPNADSAETSRLWEALDAGAIPLVIASEPWAPLPPDHPLLVAKDLQEYWNIFFSVSAMNTEELNGLQNRTIRWWIRYRHQLQFKVADLIESHLIQQAPLPQQPSTPIPLSKFTNNTYNTHNTPLRGWVKMKHRWLSSMKKAKNEALMPKPNLCVVWTLPPPSTWEFLYVHDHLLAYVDANVRYCYADDLTWCCCRHSIIVVNFVQGFTIDFNQMYHRLRTECSLSVGLIVHAAETRSAMPLIIKEGALQYDYVLHNYWYEDLNPLKPHVTWVPLGFSDNTRPASPSHIIPASRRRLFCSFRGGVSHSIRQHIDGEFRKHPRLNCSISFDKFGEKLFFRQELLETAVSLCPSGASLDTFRLWESLDAGAIPVLMPGPTFSELPKDHPLIMVDDLEGYRDVLYELKALTPEQLDAYQLRVARWWFDYRLQIQLTVTSVINSAIYSSEARHKATVIAP